MSLSSLLVCVTKAGNGSGGSIITDVSPELKRPPSSCDLRITSPAKIGISTELVLPATAVTRSVAFEKVPFPVVSGVCLIKIFHPAITSASVGGFHLSLASLSVKGS